MPLVDGCEAIISTVYCSERFNINVLQVIQDVEQIVYNNIIVIIII